MENTTKKYYWLKLNEDFFSQKEIKRLRLVAGGDTYTIIYLKILLLSLKNGGRLIFDDIGDNFIEEISLEIDEKIDNVKITIEYLKSKNLIEVVSDKEVFISKIREMVGVETDWAKKKREYRNRTLSEETKTLSDTCPSVVLPLSDKIYIKKELDIETDIETKIDDKDLQTSLPPINVVKKSKIVFIKPTVEEVAKYCLERENKIDAETFVAYYETRGWILSNKNQMKDWKSAIITWEKNSVSRISSKSADSNGFKPKVDKIGKPTRGIVL